MSDDPQNPTPKQNPLPTSPQEPTEPAPISTPISTTPEMPPRALESSPNDFSVKSTEIAPSDSTLTEPTDEPKTEAESAPISEPAEAPEPKTAQTPPNEPNEKRSFARELLISARNAIQFRKRKKLDRVMSLFLQHSQITNDEVEKFLHVSDATATRYLSQLEKEGRIKQSGKTGKAVSYSRI